MRPPTGNVALSGRRCLHVLAGLMSAALPLAFLGPAAAADPPSGARFVATARLGGEARVVIAGERYVYAGVDDQLLTLERLSSGDLRPVGPPLLMPGHIMAMDIRPPIAVVAASSLQVVVLDLADPARPVERGRTTLVGFGVNDIALAGGHAFVAQFDALSIVDATRPGHPVPLARVPGEVRSVAISAPVAYLSGFDGSVRMFDVTVPSDPIPVGRLFPEFRSNIAIADGRAYAVESPEGTLRVFDLADPRRPATIARIPLEPWAAGEVDHVAVDGRRVLVRARGFERDGTLVVLDVGPSGVATLAGRRPISGAVRDLVARGDTVFFAEGRTGIRAVDLRHPEPPPTAGMYRFPQPERGLAARDTWLYTATRHGLAVYDARDPADPREVATYEGAGLAVSMVVEGDHAWLLYRNGPDPEEHVRHGVWVVDIADPMHPLEVASLPVSTEVWTIALSGTRAYLATGTGLRIFDATDPTRPREVGAYRFRGEVMALAAGGSHVFVVHDLNAPQTFEVLDVADPAAPRSVFATGKLGGIDLRGRERSVQVQSILVRRSRVLLGVRGIGLVVLDATDPSRPIFEATYETSEPEVASLTADARYVYLATQFHEDLSPVLRVIDLDRGPEPRLVWQTTGVTHLVSSAGFGYGATASGGLAVLRFLGEPRAFLPLALGDASMQADPHP